MRIRKAAWEHHQKWEQERLAGVGGVRGQGEPASNSQVPPQIDKRLAEIEKLLCGAAPTSTRGQADGQPSAKPPP